MTKTNSVQLEAKRVRFFSDNDETAFFEWLKRIACITSFEGIGDALLLTVDDSLVDEDSLRELLALFRRYEIDMRQLSVFDKQAFASWFRAKNSYWYEAVFNAG